MNLAGDEFRSLHSALLGAFDRPMLAYMVKAYLDVNLDQIVSDGSLNQIVSELISWAERNDRVPQLIAGARDANPDNGDLKRLAEESNSWPSLSETMQPRSPSRAPGGGHAGWKVGVVGALLIGIIVISAVFIYPKLWAWTNQQPDDAAVVPSPTASSAAGPNKPAAAAPATSILDACPAPPVFDVSLDLDKQTVHVPFGQFVMGDRNIKNQEEFTVTVDAFDMDKFEVTNIQYSRFIAAAGVDPPDGWIGGSYPAGAAFAPVVNVTWDQAQEYCNWAGKRLPTEAEWEYACGGAESLIYPWGNQWNPANANTELSTCDAAVPIGSYLTIGSSPFGAADLVGNVDEWTSSRYLPYPYSPLSESDVSEGDAIRSFRGGSWQSPVLQSQCAMRANALHDMYFDTVGFRCVRTSQ